MSEFGLHWYFFLDREKLPADKVFKSLISRLKLYEQHTTSTTELYRRECTEAKKQIDVDEKAAAAAANERYTEILGSSESRDDHDWAMHASGLDELDHHYDTVRKSLVERFAEMADFFNKSSLVSLYGLMETDLRRLCFMLQIMFNKKISVDKLGDRNYLQAFLEYFESVIELPIIQLEVHIVKLKELQQLRNRIVHDGALFNKNQKDKRLADMIAAANGLLTLEPTEDPDWEILKINRIDFLFPYYKTILQFYNDLLWILEEHRAYAILLDRISQLFGYLSEKLTVTIADVKTVKKGRQVILELQAPDFPLSVICKCSIESASSDSVTITNQLNSWEQFEEFADFIEKHQDLILKNTLDIFIAMNSHSKVSFTFYSTS